MLKFRHYTVAVHDLEAAVENYQRFGMEALGEKLSTASALRLCADGLWRSWCSFAQPSGENSPALPAA
jgi:hypothetical protein